MIHKILPCVYKHHKHISAMKQEIRLKLSYCSHLRHQHTIEKFFFFSSSGVTAGFYMLLHEITTLTKLFCFFKVNVFVLLIKYDGTTYDVIPIVVIF